MAHRTKNRGGAPRTLFSLDRSSNRRGARGGTAVEDPIETTEEVTSEDETGAVTESMPAHAEPCPSCEMPLVAGAMFCGECGTRVTTEAAAIVAGDAEDEDIASVSDDGEADHAVIGAAVVGAGLAGAAVLDDDEPEVDAEQETEADAELDEDVDDEAEGELDEDAEADVDDQAAAELDEDGARDDDPDTELAEASDEDDFAAFEDEFDDDPDAYLAEDATTLTPEVETELAEDSDGARGVLVGAGVGTAAAMGAMGAMAEPAEAYGSSGSVGDSTPAGPSSGGGRKRFWLIAAGVAAVFVVIAVLAFGGSSSKQTDDVAASGVESTTTIKTTSSTVTDAPTSIVTTETSVAPTDPSTTVAALPGSSTTVTTKAASTNPTTAPTAVPTPQTTVPPPPTITTTTTSQSAASVTANPAAFLRLLSPLVMTLSNSGDLPGNWSISSSNNHILVNGLLSASGTIPGHGSTTVTFTSTPNYIYNIIITMNLPGHPSSFAAFVY